jgi:hypothetical protein
VLHGQELLDDQAPEAAALIAYAQTVLDALEAINELMFAWRPPCRKDARSLITKNEPSSRDRARRARGNNRRSAPMTCVMSYGCALVAAKK